jgi:hypothetical protein
MAGSFGGNNGVIMEKKLGDKKSHLQNPIEDSFAG